MGADENRTAWNGRLRHKAQLTHYFIYTAIADKLCLRIIRFYVELGCSNEVLSTEY